MVWRDGKQKIPVKVLLMQHTLTARLILLLLLPPLLWASNAMVGRLVVGLVPPLTLNALRWATVVLILLPLAWPIVRSPDRRAEIRARWKPLLALSFFGVGVYNALQYLALTTSTPLNVTLIAAGGPIWMLLVGALFFSEPVRHRAVLASLLSLAGVVLVLSQGSWQTLLSVRFVAGDLWMIVASISWCTYSWLLARPTPSLRPGQRPDWDWATFLWLQAAFGMVWAGGLGVGEQIVAQPGVAASWWLLAIVVIYVAIGPSIIAYRAWGLAVQQVGPALAAYFANLTPLFAALMSVVLLGTLPGWHHAAAFALIVAGIWVGRR